MCASRSLASSLAKCLRGVRLLQITKLAQKLHCQRCRESSLIQQQGARRALGRSLAQSSLRRMRPGAPPIQHCVWTAVCQNLSLVPLGAAVAPRESSELMPTAGRAGVPLGLAAAQRTRRAQLPARAPLGALTCRRAVAGTAAQAFG